MSEIMGSNFGNFIEDVEFDETIDEEIMFIKYVGKELSDNIWGFVRLHTCEKKMNNHQYLNNV
ncbi:MAG: hypothetical protein KH189_00130 [Methanobrevibacter smithii]|nr:hypothetical protein [Methanobrevibacter smithii]MBS6826545.1 hypothetical protein [Methanobrevibacter smithii]